MWVVLAREREVAQSGEAVKKKGRMAQKDARWRRVRMGCPPCVEVAEQSDEVESACNRQSCPLRKRFGWADERCVVEEAAVGAPQSERAGVQEDAKRVEEGVVGA